MNRRPLISVATVALASLALLAGCPEDKPGGTSTSGAKPPAPKTSGSGPAAGGSTSPAGSGAKTDPAPSGDSGAYGKGVIKGVVKFTGDEVVPMDVPKKRKDAEFCKTKEVKHNAIVIKDKKVKDVWVGLWNEQVKGEYKADGAKTIDQHDCEYVPRTTGLIVDQEFEIKNSDPTLHNVNAKAGTKQLFNTAQAKDADPVKKSFEEPGIYRLQCDVHAWMRSFIIVTDNPFQAVSGEDGTYTIEKVPDGKYKLVAWHSYMGKKEKDVEVKGGEVTVDFEYDGSEEEPAENKGELDDLF
jgi:plastocyanin